MFGHCWAKTHGLWRRDLLINPYRNIIRYLYFLFENWELPFSIYTAWDQYMKPHNVWFQKIPNRNPWKVTGNSNGVGVSKAKNFNGKYEAYLKLQGGGVGVQTKRPSIWRVWIRVWTIIGQRILWSAMSAYFRSESKVPSLFCWVTWKFTSFINLIMSIMTCVHLVWVKSVLPRNIYNTHAIVNWKQSSERQS